MKRIITILLIGSLAGCLDANTDQEPLEFDGTWPDLSGKTLTIMSHGDFSAFNAARGIFMNLTGIDDVVQVGSGDTGTVLRTAIDQKGRPTADLFYGLDNAFLHVALEENLLTPYEPFYADRILPAARVFGDDWYATPTDQGFIGINWDPDGPGMEGQVIRSLFDVRANAANFVTQNPTTSTPGLGFLLITIDKFGEGPNDPYNWQDYWGELMEGGTLVTPGWGDAYEGHFSGGYGVAYGGAGDHAIVNSYTESPAVEYYFGTPEANLSKALVAPGTTWHQVQTTAILNGAPNLAAAQAWIEFTLTDDYQKLAFDNGVYPIIGGIDTDAYYGGVDPAPGTFQPIDLDFATIGENLERWLDEWEALCLEHECI